MMMRPIWFWSLAVREAHVIASMSLCLNVNKGPPITKSLMPQNVPSLSPFLSILTSPRHPIIFSYPSLSSPILAFRPPIAISTSCLGVASTSHCSCSLNSSLHSSSASLVGAYTWMTVEFSKRESKRAFMILSLIGFHFSSVLFTSFFRMSPTPLWCPSSNSPEYKMLPSVAVWNSLQPVHRTSHRPGVRFSKVSKIVRARKLFGALFGRISRVSKSVSQSTRFSPDIFGNLFGICGASSSASWNFPACDWCKIDSWHRCTELVSSRTRRTHQNSKFCLMNYRQTYRLQRFA